MSYSTLLRRHGLKWVRDSNPKMAVGHVVSAINPQQLRTRLPSDLDLAYKYLRKDLKHFIAHALDHLNAFKKVDIGPTYKKQTKSNKDRHGNGRTRGGGASNRGTSPLAGQRDKTTKSHGSPRKPSFCPHPPCMAMDERHWIDNCMASTDNQKRDMAATIAAARAHGGPGRSKPGQKPRTGDVEPVSSSLDIRHTWNYGPHHALTRCTRMNECTIVLHDCVRRWPIGGSEKKMRQWERSKHCLPQVGGTSIR